MRTRLWVLNSVNSTAHCFFLLASCALPFHAPPAAVWVIKSIYSTRHHGICARGKGGPQTAHLLGWVRDPLFSGTSAAAAAGGLVFRAPPDAFAAAGWAALPSESPFCPNAASSVSASAAASASASASASALASASASPPPSLTAAAAAAAAARACFLALSCWMISYLVRVGIDAAGPSGLVRSVTYRTMTSWRRKCRVASVMFSRSDIACS
jgi:hypothetical protein